MMYINKLMKNTTFQKGVILVTKKKFIFILLHICKEMKDYTNKLEEKEL